MSSDRLPSGKPLVVEEDVRALLGEHFTAPIENLSGLAGGEVAQIYAFSAGGAEYILRITPHMGANLDKEVFVQGLLAASPETSLIPLPPVLYRGRLGALHYAVTRRMPGLPLPLLPPSEYAATIPALLTTLDVIHSVDVRATTGYGVFGDDGIGFFPSWRESLTAVGNVAWEEDAHGRRQSAFQTTFPERDVWDTVYARMVKLLDVCPEERYLVHGDYGFDNALAEDRRVTAVLDWLNAQYGDFLYDVAWLAFWPSDFAFQDLCAARYAERGVAIANYSERILCYQCHIALNSLRFFAARGNEQPYRWVRQVILSRLG